MKDTKTITERNEYVQRVILTNPDALKEFGFWSYVSLFRGTGHSEWEFAMSNMLLNAIENAIHTDSECDISKLFNTDFDSKFTRKDVFNHIINFFTVEKEADNTLWLSLNV